MNNLKLINDELNGILDTLVGDMFALNRMIDRMISVLDVKFVMKNTVKFIHPQIAHAFPRLADLITEYQSSRNMLSVYPATPIGNEDYSNITGLFETMFNGIYKVENNICSSIKRANEFEDETTKEFLRTFLTEFSKYTTQAQILMDKSKMYGDSLLSYTQFDRDIELFMSLEV